jgi:salicylate 5-hydroxylase large subunit
MDAVTELQTRTWPVEGAARVPFWVYGDQDVYEREQERIFGGPNWSYVRRYGEVE